MSTYEHIQQGPFGLTAIVLFNYRDCPGDYRIVERKGFNNRQHVLHVVGDAPTEDHALSGQKANAYFEGPPESLEDAKQFMLDLAYARRKL